MLKLRLEIDVDSPGFVGMRRTIAVDTLLEENRCNSKTVMT
jgi:hypothetical protein